MAKNSKIVSGIQSFRKTTLLTDNSAVQISESDKILCQNLQKCPMPWIGTLTDKGRMLTALKTVFKINFI